MNHPDELSYAATPIAHRVSRAVEISGVPKTTLYEAMKQGHLQAVKLGRRTLILDASLRGWLANLPRYSS